MRFRSTRNLSVGFGDFDVPDVLAEPVAQELRDPEIQTYLRGVGRDIVRSQLSLSRAGGPSSRPGLDKIIASLTSPIVAGVRDEGTTWALGALAVAGIVGYALGRR